MKLSEWKPRLRARFQQWLPADTWELRSPESPGSSSAMLPPIRNLTLETKGHQQYFCTLVQDFFYQLRYPESSLYHQLPIGTIEGIHGTFSLRLLKSWSDLGELLGLNLLKVEEPVRVSETEGGEWLVTLHWAFEVEFYLDPEVTLDTPYLLNKLVVGVKRTLIKDDLQDFSDNNLDYRASFPVNLS